MDAFFQFNPETFANVCDKLKAGGWTDADIEHTLYYNPKFFLQRVERSVPPPDILYWRVRAVFVTFGYCEDAKTKAPLFQNKRMWSPAKQILD